jgi:hypothetical protein
MAATPPTLFRNFLLNCYKNTPWEARCAPQVLAAILLLLCARARISSVISFGVLNVLLLLNFSWPVDLWRLYLRRVLHFFTAGRGNARVDEHGSDLRVIRHVKRCKAQVVANVDGSTC